MRCKYCNSDNISKKGYVSVREKQRYFCFDCKRTFTIGDFRKGRKFSKYPKELINDFRQELKKVRSEYENKGFHKRKWTIRKNRYKLALNRLKTRYKNVPSLSHLYSLARKYKIVLR